MLGTWVCYERTVKPIIRPQPSPFPVPWAKGMSSWGRSLYRMNFPSIFCSSLSELNSQWEIVWRFHRAPCKICLQNHLMCHDESDVCWHDSNFFKNPATIWTTPLICCRKCWDIQDLFGPQGVLIVFFFTLILSSDAMSRNTASSYSPRNLEKIQCLGLSWGCKHWSALMYNRLRFATQLPMQISIFLSLRIFMKVPLKQKKLSKIFRLKYTDQSE